MADTATPQSENTADATPPRELHVVAVGASAGGLEALEEFFGALPSDTGMAFVVIQHLSPDFKSHMEELLARHTRMAIHRVENDMVVAPNSVYLIPPKMEMVMADGRLLITEKGKDRAFFHPIDQFFRSLADDAGPRAVGVVLSGTGSDGSRGVRAIHEAGGLVLVQDERSAKFDGMPLNAQATGVASAVLPPKAIAESLVNCSRQGFNASSLEKQFVPAAEVGLERIFQLLHQQHGIDFSHYKSTTVGRRLQRRIDLLKLPSMEAYLELVETDSAELNDLYKDLLIGVTKFFRDPAAFEVLERQVIPALLEKHDIKQPIRVWVAGCASGEEAYSLAILMDEAVRKRGVQREFKIFATDAHHVSLHAAARGVFPEETLNELSDERRERYFRKQRDGYHVTRELRQMIVFAPHNVISDAPFTQMDLVTCRNLLIYLQPSAQKKALALFHFALKPGATLFLGPSESPGDWSDEFDTLDKRWRVYHKRRDVRLPIDVRMPLLGSTETLPRASINPALARTPRIDASLLGTYDRLLDRKMPPSFLVSSEFEILHIFGGAERFMQLRGGRPSSQLLQSVVEPLKLALTGALQHALQKHDVVKYTGLQIPNDDGVEKFNISIEPITDPATKAVSLLVELESVGQAKPHTAEVSEVSVDPSSRERVSTLESELRYTQENLQATIEEMETSNEELHATNEELVASNEELQSTNEELHSVNEELYTVNAEHQRRVEELAEANDDMDNLLATTRVGVVFLDDEMFIRRYTPEVAKIFHLGPQDVGRSIEGFLHYLADEGVIDVLRTVLQEQEERELNVEDRTGTPFLLRVLPYRSGSNVHGVVMTLIDISSLMKAQSELERFRFMAEEAFDAQALVDPTGRLAYVNPSMCKWLGYSSRDLKGKPVADIEAGGDGGVLQYFARTDTPLRQPLFESEWRRADGTLLPVEISASVVKFRGSRFVYLNARDITSRRDAEQEMRVQQLAIESAQNGILISDATKEDNPVTFVNPGFETLSGYTADEIMGKNCRMLQGPSTDEACIRRIREAIAGGKPIRETILNYRKDGTPFWNDLQITPVQDRQGRLIAFVGIQHDVTNRVESEANARYDSERTQAILNTAAEGIFGIDHEGNCTFCNASAAKLLGYGSTEGLVGRNMHEVIHYSNGVQMCGDDCDLSSAANRHQAAFDASETFWRKDGKPVRVEYWSSPLVNRGQFEGAVISFQDITERIALTSRLEHMGQMINASHDAIIVWELDGDIVSWNAGGNEALWVLGRGSDWAAGKYVALDHSPDRVGRDCQSVVGAGGVDRQSGAHHASGQARRSLVAASIVEAARRTPARLGN